MLFSRLEIHKVPGNYVIYICNYINKFKKIIIKIVYFYKQHNMSKVKIANWRN
jgi:hypothetical protein